MRERALIAMSGGVDSSVAAFLVREMGYDCIGAMMKLYTNEDLGLERTRTCCSLDDASDARAVAFRLGMPFYVFNFADEFREKVIGEFISEYERGRTPNPCITCNRCLKFERFLRRARELECEKMATGHYARIERMGNRFLLKKALDASKDQSYVLYSMTQEQLARTLLPLGALTKREAREIAAAQGFVNAEKPDSQDICFVPDGDYAGFLERTRGKAYPPGDFLNARGEKIGEHRGAIRYTIGQRKGLGLALGFPAYVCAKDMRKNTVTVSDERALFSREATVENVNWIACDAPAAPIRAQIRVRYRQPEQPARIHPISETRVRIEFDAPQRAVTPGQAAVFYDGDTVLGGGVIGD